MRGTGRGLQQTHFRELFGSRRHRLFSLSFRFKQSVQDGERLREHQFDRWFFEFVQQQGVSAFGKKPRVEANNAEVAQTSFDLRFAARLFTAQVFVMSHQLFTQAAVIGAVAIKLDAPD